MIYHPIRRNFMIENIDYVICKVCGEKLGVINHLHLRKHNLTSSEYSIMHPDAVLSCKNMLDKRSKKLKGKTRTEETKKKMSHSLKQSWINNPSQGRTGHSLSEESKKSLSDKLKGHFVSDETRKKIGQSGLGRKPWNDGLTKDTSEKMMSVSKKTSEWNKKFMTDEKKKQISKTLKLRYMNGMKIPNSANGFRNDLNMSFRSTWEANYARILEHNKQKIVYEKQRFPLYKDNELYRVYTPDFKLSDTKYVELKGHAESSSVWTCSCSRCIRDKEKLELFKIQYPDIDLCFIGKKEYKDFSDRYALLINNWEFYKGQKYLQKRRKQMIRIFMYTFNKPIFYFDDCSSPKPEDLRRVGSFLKNVLDDVADAIEKLTKSGGWYFEIMSGDISLWNDTINNKKDFLDLIEKLQIPSSLFSIDEE